MVPFMSIGRIGNRYVNLYWQPAGIRERLPLPSQILFYDAAWTAGGNREP
jgi:hypothetical protein